MLEQGNFQDLIRRVRAGDQAAAAELVRLYEPAIRRAARVRIVDPRLRSLLDSVDISQSVFASFFVRAALGQYELEKPAQLLNLLVNMSRKKLAAQVRKEAADRRDYRRAQTGAAGQNQLPSTGLTPGRQVAMEELIREFRKRLTPEERELAELRAGGREWHQIAAERGESSEALRKRLARAVERISQDLGLDDLADE